MTEIVKLDNTDLSRSDYLQTLLDLGRDGFTHIIHADENEKFYLLSDAPLELKVDEIKDVLDCYEAGNTYARVCDTSIKLQIVKFLVNTF